MLRQHLHRHRGSNRGPFAHCVPHAARPQRRQDLVRAQTTLGRDRHFNSAAAITGRRSYLPALLSARVPRWRMKMSPVLRPRV